MYRLCALSSVQFFGLIGFCASPRNYDLNINYSLTTHTHIHFTHPVIFLARKLLIFWLKYSFKTSYKHFLQLQHNLKESLSLLLHKTLHIHYLLLLITTMGFLPAFGVFRRAFQVSQLYRTKLLKSVVTTTIKLQSNLERFDVLCSLQMHHGKET